MYKYYGTFILLLLLNGILLAQAEVSDTNIIFKINHIELNKDDGFIDVFINAKDGTQRILPKDINIIAKDRISGGEFQDAAFQNAEVLTSSERQIPNVLFLLDISGSMRKGDKIGKAKAEIKKLIEQHEFGSTTTFFATFGNDVSPSAPLTRGDYDNVVGNVRANNKSTDLNYAIKSKVEEMSVKAGRSVIILLTDGRDANAYNPKYLNDPSIIVSPEEVIQTVSQVDSTLRIYAIGYGDRSANIHTVEGFQSGIDEPFLINVVESTQSREDDYQYTSGPELGSIFQNIMAELEENIVLHFLPAECKFVGLPRDLKLDYEYGSKTGTATRAYNEGSSAAPETLCDGAQSSMWIQAVLGLFLILGLLALLQYLVPVIGTYRFKNKYVMPYSQYLASMGQANTKTRRMDPYTGEQLLPHDLVVTKCEHLNRWESWEYNKHKCVYYPDKGCSQGFSTYNKQVNFFRQQGANRKLNWLWFGALGGFVSWLLFNFLTYVGIQPLLDTIVTNFPIDGASLYRQVLVGMSLGAGLALCLAISEELGTSRSSRSSTSRILKRILMGVLLAFPIFFFQEWFYNNIIGVQYIGGLVGWLLFGVALGYIVSIDSSIDARKGISGGALAAAVAYQAYFLIFKFLDPTYANLIGFIIFGSILGYMIVAIVERLEKFELIVQSPENFEGRRIAISKWLTSGQNEQIYIGTDPSVYVYVKWRDEVVKSRHAALSYDGQVNIEALEETLVNGRSIPIGERVQLQHNDLIQLGHRSVSMFRYLSTEDQTNTISHSTIDPTQAAREEELRSRIKINVSPRKN